MTEEELIEDIRKACKSYDQETAFRSYKQLEYNKSYEQTLDLFLLELDKLKDEKNKEISILQKELDKKDICLKTCEDNLIKERQLRIKQNKVIDLMAEDRAEISEPKTSKEAIINYYFKKVEVEDE